ncbi:hypothetical protein NA57DRAFT_82167 [Rhizodiscina lignyota]|uniref:Uncharacterized protein n=1 Tax=Rhizodiscina lignyota TaxID=1504668 RepID=A0A9P4I540_9PEZI|nr:hypothetical protein NA57DRAFT_82167 [Rhizodiscina lignyota]
MATSQTQQPASTPKVYVEQHGGTRGIAGNVTSFLAVDEFVTINNLPPQAAVYEMRSLEQRARSLGSAVWKGTTNPVTKEPFKAGLCPGSISSEIEGYMIHLYQLRGFDLAEIIGRIPVEAWSKGRKARPPISVMKGNLSMRAQRYRTRVGVLDHFPGDLRKYTTEKKGFKEDMAKISRLNDLQLLYGVHWDIHSNGSMSQPYFGSRRGEGIPLGFNPPRYALPEPKEVSDRVRKLLESSGRRVPTLADLPVIHAQISWTGPPYNPRPQAQPNLPAPTSHPARQSHPPMPHNVNDNRGFTSSDNKSMSKDEFFALFDNVPNKKRARDEPVEEDDSDEANPSHKRTKVSVPTSTPGEATAKPQETSGGLPNDTISSDSVAIPNQDTLLLDPALDDIFEKWEKEAKLAEELDKANGFKAVWMFLLISSSASTSKYKQQSLKFNIQPYKITTPNNPNNPINTKPQDAKTSWVLWPQKGLSREYQADLEAKIQAVLDVGIKLEKCVIFPEEEGIRYWAASATREQAEKVKSLPNMLTLEEECEVGSFD